MDFEKEMKRANRRGFWSGILTATPLILVALQTLVILVLLPTLNFEAIKISNYVFLVLVVGIVTYNIFFLN